MNNHDLLNALMRRRLATFAEKAFGAVLPGDTFLPNWHLDALAHYLQQVAEGRLKRLVITVPPRSGKSIMASVVFPAWILGHDPTRRLICASYAQDLSVKLHNQCRALMGSALYRAAFPGTRLSATKNTETEFETNRGGWRLATSVDGVITGRGANVVIIDDPMKAGDAESETIRNRVNTWFDSTLFTRLESRKEGAFVLVMQRLHVDDLAGHLLEQDGWTHLNLPAVAEVDELIRVGPGRVHARRVGDLLHPEREGQAELDDLKRTLGTAAFAAQFQQQPVPLGGNMIDWRWFRFYTREPEREPGDAVIQSWDTASKPGELNDYSVGTTWLIRGERYYLLDLHRERCDAPTLRKRVIAEYREYRPEGVLIEDKGSGTSLLQELQHTGEMPVVAIEPKGDKVVRASAQSVRIEGGQVWLPAAAPWLGEFQREVMAFPKGRHDDQVDSMSQFLIYAWDSVHNAPRIRVL